MPHNMTALLVTVLARTRNEDLSTIYLKAGSLPTTKKERVSAVFAYQLSLLKVTSEIAKSAK